MRVSVAALAAVLLAAGIGLYVAWPAPGPKSWLGYADADYVKMAPTAQGRLVRLAVARGDTVQAGALLFAQDDGNDRALRDQAAAALAEAQEKLTDMRKPARDAEILQARADVADAQAASDRAARDLARSLPLLPSGGASRQSVDEMRDDALSAKARLDAAQARLSLLLDSDARAHAIEAQQAAVLAAAASLRSAQWRLDQDTVAAPAAGLIADTYARPGETVAAGTPVVSLLPPENILLRFFVPETMLSRLRPGEAIGIACDSCPPHLTGRISFIATGPEYTPPVIYSQASRGSLVYLIEARPDPASRPLLKPGQPVDVSLPPAAPAP